jgi:hypothetical protein
MVERDIKGSAKGCKLEKDVSIPGKAERYIGCGALLR